MTIFSVVCAFFGARVLQIAIEELAVADIQRLGGRVSRQSSRSLADDGWITRTVTFILFEDLAYVTEVSLNRTAITDGEVERLKPLGHLRGLDISNTSISDNALVILADIPSCRVLHEHFTHRLAFSTRSSRRVGDHPSTIAEDTLSFHPDFPFSPAYSLALLS